MSNSKIFEFIDLPCPRCGSTKYKIGDRSSTYYNCATKDCYTTLYECKKCNKVQYKSAYGRIGDAWRCKECEAIQWDLTEKERVLSTIRGARNSLNDIIKRNGL